MIYFPEDHETAESIASKWNGGADASLALQIMDSNTISFGSRMFPGTNLYAADYPVWVPGMSSEEDPEIAQDAIVGFENLLPYQRVIVANWVRSGFDLHTLAYANNLAMLATKAMTKESEDHWYSWFEETCDWLKGSMHMRNKQLENFLEAVENLQAKLEKTLEAKAMKNAKQVYHQLRGQFKREYKIVQSQFAQEIERFHVSSNVIYRKFGKMEGAAEVRGLEILHTSEGADIVRMASRLERVVAGLWVVGISTGCYEVYESYKQHEPWIKEALNVTVDLGEAVVAGMFIAGFISSGGWAIAIVAGAADVAITSLVNYGTNKLFEKVNL